MKSFNLLLNNGVKYPVVGFGTAMDHCFLKKSLEYALNCGYRQIDTAQVYLNEHIIGEVLHDYFLTGKLTRSDIFITSKLAPFYHQPEYVAYSIEESLRKLKTNYIDLFLIHVPCSYTPVKELDIVQNRHKCYKTELEIDMTPHIVTWRILEKYYKEGKLKAIGVSNFNCKQLLDLYIQAEIKPMYLQTEIHIFQPQYEMQALCEKLNIVVGAFSCMQNHGDIYIKDFDAAPLKYPLIIRLAEKYEKTPAQIILRQLLQRKIAIIPRSSSPKHIFENIDIFSFSLTDLEMNEFENISYRGRFRTFFSFINHPRYPYPEERYILENKNVVNE